MSKQSEISADARTESAGAIAGERDSRLRIMLVPSINLSSSESSDSAHLSSAFGGEADIVVLSSNSINRGLIHREFDLWTRAQRAAVLIVRISGLADLMVRWFPALVLSRLHGKRVIGSVDFGSTHFQTPIVRFGIRKLLGKADALVTSTEWQAGGLRRIGLLALVISPVQEAVATAPVAKIQPHLCVSIGRDQLGEWERIVQSFVLIKQKYPRAEMTVIAPRKLHDIVFQQAIQSNASIQQCIHIVDRSPSSAKSSCDLVISLDRDSEFPRQLVAAWRVGRPVLVLAFSLVSSVVRDNFNGLIYSSASVAGLADAVIRLVENPELVQQLSVQGLAEARAYHWEALRVRWRQALFAKK
jgi:hypothetical protein